jgi:hypothetical protein
MKTYGGNDVYFHVFLTSPLFGDEWLASSLCRFTPGERAPGTHWKGSWVGPRAGLGDVERRKYCSHQDSNSDPLAVQSVASPYTDCAIPAITIINKYILSAYSYSIQLHGSFFYRSRLLNYFPNT